MSDETGRYEIVKFVSPSEEVDALEGRAVHCYGPDGDVGGILREHDYGDDAPPDVYMVGIYDVLTDRELVRTDIRNFTEIIVP